MSELTDKVQRMLTQAQRFADEAPLEAVARAQLALRTLDQALVEATAVERADLDLLREMTLERIHRYEAGFAAWSSEVADRARLFEQHERERLAQPIPPKV